MALLAAEVETAEVETAAIDKVIGIHSKGTATAVISCCSAALAQVFFLIFVRHIDRVKIIVRDRA